MILSPLSVRDLSRSLSVSRQWNKTVLESAELRRTLFMEARQAREYLQIMKGQDRRCYEFQSRWQPVVVSKPSQPDPREIVESHPSLVRKAASLGSSSDVNFTVPYFGSVKAVPASAFLFQPPLQNITIEHWGRTTKLQNPGGVTFGEVLVEIEKIRAASKAAIERSPRFAGHLYGRVDQMTLSIRADNITSNDANLVKQARRALAMAQQLASQEAFPR
jgi:hypothetical protein